MFKIGAFFIALMLLQADYMPLLQSANYPTDVSFMIIDLKYGPQGLKVCEFGKGSFSGFVGHERLYGKGAIWQAWWAFLRRLQKPLLILSPSVDLTPFSLLTKRYANANNPNFPLAQLSKLDGLIASSLPGALKAFKAQGGVLKDTMVMALGTYNFYKDYEATGQSGLIPVDYATHAFALNKLLMHGLFASDPAVAHYRPLSCIVPVADLAFAADGVSKKIPADAYVIKPINGWKGNGIEMCLAKDLEGTLKAIASNAFAFKSTNIIVESMEHSFPILIENKWYDPTMRVALGLFYHQSSIKMKILGAYWKLPEACIEDSGASLRETFLSHIRAKGAPSSAKVDKKMLAQVEKELQKFVPHVYKKMVALSYGKIDTVILEAAAKAELVKD